jgi:hypothetical protein
VLLVTAGDNAQRITTEAECAMLCGIAPIPATSGLVDNRFGLNPAGDRHANNAIWRIVITRLGQRVPRTVAYMHRRLAEACPHTSGPSLACPNSGDNTLTTHRSAARSGLASGNMRVWPAAPCPT